MWSAAGWFWFFPNKRRHMKKILCGDLACPFIYLCTHPKSEIIKCEHSLIRIRRAQKDEACNASVRSPSNYNPSILSFTKRKIYCFYELVWKCTFPCYILFYSKHSSVFILQKDHKNIQMKIDKYQNYFREKELEVSF